MKLDDLVEIPALCREDYGVDKSNKPNDPCYWDYDFGRWEEDDEHYRSRVLSRRLKNG